MFSKLTLLTVTALVLQARAQSPITPEDVQQLNRGVEQSTGGKLSCSTDTIKPFLDFGFRFESGYIVHCPIREFDGKKSVVVSFVRVTPEGGKPVVLGEGFNIPEMPPNMRAKVELHRVNSQFDFSGVFRIGEGRYGVELRLLDNLGRSFEKHWKIQAVRRRNEQAVPVTMPDRTAEAIALHPWNGKLADGGQGLRITVLLNAAPVNPYALRLRAWDRALLLDTLTSLLSQIRCASVRLVAFNLDQQREVYRQESLDANGFSNLSKALRNLELGTVSYRVVQQQEGWSEMLADISNKEISGRDTSDAVIFLGPTNRLSAKVPPELLKSADSGKPSFFYLEYVPEWRRGREFPDVVHYLTSAYNGTIYKIHSPAELAQAIQKMQAKLAAAGQERSAGGSHGR